MQIKLTKFSRTDGDKLLCKKISLVDGEMEKTSSANMLKGKFETVNVDFNSEFGDFLKSLSLDQALGLGICQFCASGRIVTRSSNKENVNNSVVCRTKDNFIWNPEHNLIFFDIDKNTADIDQIIAELYTVCPELIETDLWAYPSAGSCVLRDDEDKDEQLEKTISGWHIYFILKGDVDAFQQWLEVKLWNGGQGWIEVSKSGAMLRRSLVDFAVFSPERLDFIAGSHCGDGLTQERGEPIKIDSGGTEPLDGDWVIDPGDYREYLSRVERAKFGKESESVETKKGYAGSLVASGKAPDIATALKLIDSANEEGELMGSWQIILDDGTMHSVASILDRPDQFDGLTCSDPLEPDYGGGRCKAKIFWNIRGTAEVRVTSFAHGGRHWVLKYDYQSLLDWIDSEGVTIETIISSWKHKMSNKNSILSQEEKNDILKKIKSRLGGSTDLKSLKETLKKVEVEACMKEIDDEIKELNKSFAVLPIGNKVRILREFENIGFDGKPKIDFTIISKQDFSLLKQNKLVLVGDKMKPITEIWLASRDRKEFKGIEFNPSIIGEFDGYYNPFKGLAIEPKQGDWKLMQDHILNIICGGNEEYYHWLICWCANCVKNPGGDRVGTAVVLIGNQGTGKGMFVNWFGKIFGQHFLPISSTRRLVGNFNSHLKDVILLFADEAYWGGNVSEEGVLKQLITEDTIPIEPKGVDTYAVTNHVNLIMATNNEWAVPAGLDDRRFFVLNVSEEMAVNEAYFKPLQAQMENGGLPAMMYDLMEMEIDVNLRNTPKTAALFKQKMQKMSYEEEFIYWAMNIDDIEVWDNFVSMPRLYEKFQEHTANSTKAPHQTQATFARRIEKVLRTIATRKRGYVDKQRAWGFQFCDIQKARTEFEKMVGQKITWLELADDPADL